MTESASIYRYFAATSPGLESCLRDELQGFGIRGEPTAGGVEFRGPIEMLWSVALQSRIAESIRLRLKSFRASDFASLEHQLAKLPFHAYVTPHSHVEISVSCTESRLYHTGAIEERLRGVLARSWDRHAAKTRDSKLLDEAPPLAEPAQSKIFIRAVRNEFTVSVDATLERLHRRGYRTHVGVAPLRETLAAAACRLLEAHSSAGGIQRLWDPCCGSGTLLCEWLQMHHGILPGFATVAERHFGFEHWPSHPKIRYREFRAQIRGNCKTSGGEREPVAFGTDSDAETLRAAAHNLRAAMVFDSCRLFSHEFADAGAKIPQNTAVITNLPYGVRLKQIRSAPSPFVALDSLFTRRTDLRPALVISTERPPPRSKNRWKSACGFANGGLAVTAWILVPDV